MPDHARQTPPTVEPAADLLPAYLARRDVPCPVCKYNLRGCTGAACPECGTTIALTVRAERQPLVPPLLAFLAFGWVLLAGTLNTARNAHYVYDYAQTRSYYGTALRLQGPGRISVGPGGSITIVGPSVSSGASAGASNQSGGPVTAWSNVPGETWWRLAWSLALMVGGAIGVIALLRHRSRPLSEWAWRLLRAHALALFTVYGGYHLYMFGQEVLAW